MKTCPHCGTENRDIARFCAGCSQPLVTELVCPSCKTANPVSARFCQNCATPLRGNTTPAGMTGMLPANTILSGRYSVIQKLGRGGMGAVYQVADKRLTGKQWAMKELSDAALLDPAERQTAVQNFQHEATLLASLNHPNLTRVVDFFQENNKYYLVMDLVEGQTLDDMLTGRVVPFSEKQVLEWALQICDVLAYLHRQNPAIIFRDLKPANIMVDKDGKVRLIDFGIARLFKPGKSHDTASFGTAGYAPPEQYGKGQTDARSDIYALGATLHHLLTLRDPGDDPFNFPSIRPLNNTVSRVVDDAILKAVNRQPGDRWQSAVEMSKALKGEGKSTPVVAAAIPAPVAAMQSAPASMPPLPLTNVAAQSAATPVSSTPVSQKASGDPFPPLPMEAAPPATSKPAAQVPNNMKKSGFWGYVLWLLIMISIVFIATRIELSARYSSYQTSLIVGAIMALGAAAITKRPLASGFVLLATYALLRDLTGIDFEVFLVFGLPVELFFLFSGYKRYNFGWLTLAYALGFAALVAFDIGPSFTFIFLALPFGAGAWFVAKICNRI